MTNDESPVQRSRPKVAYLGEPNDLTTYGAQATEHFFGRGVVDGANDRFEFVARRNHREVIQALWREEVDFGVVAIESTVDGVVSETARGVSKISALGIHVLEEVVLPITFYLFATEQAFFGSTVTVHAHEKAWGQCYRLREHLARAAEAAGGKMAWSQAESNAAAAARVAALRQPNQLAITTWQAVAAHPGLKLAPVRMDATEPGAVLEVARVTNSAEAADVGDYKRAGTRFWKLGHGNYTSPGLIQGESRTCILLNLDQRSPGGLHDALGPFARHRCNLAIIYPIPIAGRDFEYSFMLEFYGHISHPDGRLKAAFDELLEMGLSLNTPTIFGSYPTIVLKSPPSDSVLIL